MRSAVDLGVNRGPILLEFGPINDLLPFVIGRRWCRSLAKVTKQVKIEKSKLFVVIPKTISVIPYPYNFLVSYPLSLKLFCQLSLIPKTPNRASVTRCLVWWSEPERRRRIFRFERCHCIFSLSWLLTVLCETKRNETKSNQTKQIIREIEKKAGGVVSVVSPSDIPRNRQQVYNQLRRVEGRKGRKRAKVKAKK